MRKATMSLSPKKARVLRGKSAWWYDECGAISVFVEGISGAVLSCQIKRSHLIKYIERSKKK